VWPAQHYSRTVHQNSCRCSWNTYRSTRSTPATRFITQVRTILTPRHLRIKFVFPPFFVVADCHAGDISHSIYIIKSGSCLVVNSHGVVLAELSDNDVFGEVSCFLSERRPHTCMCLRFSEMYVLTASKLAIIMKIFPDFYAFLSLFCRKKKMAEMSTKRQFSAAIFDLPNSSQPPSPSSTALHAPLSPHLAPFQKAKHATLSKLEPLPKGKYRAPKSPDVAELLWNRTSRLTHEERVRLVAEIQVDVLKDLNCTAITTTNPFCFAQARQQQQQSNTLL
jgi:hypothetical protein